MKTKLICHKCEAESPVFNRCGYEKVTPEGWETLIFQSGYYQKNVSFAFCPTCANKAGLVSEKERKDLDKDKLENILWNLMCDAAGDAVAEVLDNR